MTDQVGDRVRLASSRRSLYENSLPASKALRNLALLFVGRKRKICFVRFTTARLILRVLAGHLVVITNAYQFFDSDRNHASLVHLLRDLGKDPDKITVTALPHEQRRREIHPWASLVGSTVLRLQSHVHGTLGGELLEIGVQRRR